MRWFALLLIFCVCVPLAAQDPIPDTTEVWRYFPLDMGDVWEYRAEFELLPPDCFPACVQNWRRTVIDDSVIGDFTYKTILLEKFNLIGEEIDSSTEFYRLDTLSAEIRQPNGTGEMSYGGTRCGLDSPFPPEGEQMECEPGSNVTGEGYDRQVEVGTDIVFTTVKSFWTLFFGGGFRFAADIGMVSNVGCEVSCWDYQLTYADVGGVTYGTPFPVGVEPESPRSSALRITSAYPNPLTGRFLLDVALTKPEALKIDVYDVLGRRIHAGEELVTINGSPVGLDATNWPRGLYLVRVTTADGQVATTRITRQ